MAKRENVWDDDNKTWASVEVIEPVVVEQPKKKAKKKVAKKGK